MRLYVLESTDFQSFWGLPFEPIVRAGAITVAQKPDCSAFLVLSPEAYSGLVLQNTIPEGFDFTYCQAWGLAVNEATLHRVISDLRAKAYPHMPDYLDAIVKEDEEALETYLEACLAVKAKYPKFLLA